MSENQGKNYSIIYFYIMAVTFLICIIPFLCYKLPFVIMFPAFLIILFCIILTWRTQLSKKSLYLLDILNILAAVFLGYLLVYHVFISEDGIFGYIAGIATIDVISFTKIGKNTINAKLAGSTNKVARLSICLPVPKKPGLKPLIGVGDLLYYSVIIMYCLKSGGISAGWIGLLIVLAGQFVNNLAISLLRNKPWFKGYPATLFPGIFFIISAFIKMI